jgi:hypothetical protein
VFKGATGHVDAATFGADRTAPAAGRTGLLVAQQLGLLRGGLFEGAGGQAAGRSLSDLLQLRQIDIQPGSLVPEGTSDDDFSPVLGEIGDALQIIGSQLARAHEEIFLEVRARRRDELPDSYPMAGPWTRKVRPALGRGKQPAIPLQIAARRGTFRVGSW